MKLLKNYLSIFSITTVLTIVLLFPNFSLNAQNKKAACIAFYNVENLFDTINDPKFNDEDFLPDGLYRWTGERYWKKISNISEVISQIGNEYVTGGPTVIGLAEIENDTVLTDLVNSPALKKSEYGIVHYNCEYNRGVDVGFLYRKDIFKVISSKTFKVVFEKEPDYKTRDILLVTGNLDGEKMHVIVNHWPSRRGGERASAPNRIDAAKVCRSIVDSLMQDDPNAKIFVMGDLNDDPNNESVQKHLNAKGNLNDVKTGDLFNTDAPLFKKGIGSLAYQDSWNLFDQIIISEPLLRKEKGTYHFLEAKIFNKKFITQKEGQYAGYPLRTYVGETYTGGYADHFPSYVFIVKE